MLDVLRLGTHQLLAMRVPDHAAISTSVDLVRATVSEGAAGFTNAVLRKVAAHDLDTWIAQVAPDRESDPQRHAEIAFSHPAWVVDELRKAVGADELEALLAADNVPPKVTLVARPGRSTRDELPGTPTPYSPYGVVLDGRRARRGAGRGRGTCRRAGRGLAARRRGAGALARRRPVDRADRTDRLWVDLCAGPGGKAALLAALAAERGAAVARDRAAAAPRAAGRPLPGRRRAASWGVVTADGVHPPLRPAPFDRVLVDAPCSGLGALRRRPEARWRRKPDDLLPLVLLQRQLLGLGPRPGATRRGRALRDLLAGHAETTDVVSTVVGARDDVSSRTPARCCPRCPTVPGGCRAPCSCGRTATAPTRCSWRCCAAAADPVVARLTQAAPPSTRTHRPLRWRRGHEVPVGRDRGRRPRRPGEQPRPRLLPGPAERCDQARPRRVLPRRRAGHRQRALRAALHAAPLPQGARRPQGAPEAAAAGGAALGRDRAAALPALEPHRRRALRHRARPR